MKSVLLISDVPETKYIVAPAMQGIDDAVLIGELRSLWVALEKLASLEPDIVLIEQQSMQINGIMLAARMESEGLSSSVILLHPDDMPDKAVYSGNIKGYLSYSDINTKKLSALFNAVDSPAVISSKKLGGSKQIPFARFRLIIAVFPPTMPALSFNGKCEELIALLGAVEHYICMLNEHSCAVFLKSDAEPSGSGLVSRLALYFSGESGHCFVFPPMAGNNPVQQVLEAYSFSEDINCFFDENEKLTVLEQIEFLAQIDEAFIQHTLSALELALEEGDVQRANQLCFELFGNRLRRSLSMSAYRKAVNGFNDCVAALGRKSGFDFISERLSTQNTVSSTLEQALRMVRNLLGAVGKGYSSRICSAIYYMRNRLSEKISLQDIAEHSYTSPSYLSQCFSREVGCTVTDYLLRLRIRRACELLKRDVHISDVAAACGFEDNKYFLRRFKRCTGLTPTEYREKHREVNLP